MVREPPRRSPHTDQPCEHRRVSCCSTFSATVIATPRAPPPAVMDEAVSFTVDVPVDVLDDLDDRLARIRWPSRVSRQAWQDGVAQQFLRRLVARWRDGYDWRSREMELNSLSVGLPVDRPTPSSPRRPHTAPARAGPGYCSIGVLTSRSTPQPLEPSPDLVGLTGDAGPLVPSDVKSVGTAPPRR